MKFLKLLPTINSSSKVSELALLDLAYVVTLLPLFVILKAPMILFSLLIVVILFFKHKPLANGFIFLVFILGILAVYLSLYGAFSFSGLSKLKLFLELLVYILIIVVSMQRVTREINFYLLISPFLFLALSLFFYHSILMLIYVVFEVFFLLWMILAHRMEGDIVESFRSSIIMFMYSIPWVVILFIFFPRISFEHANYGFKGETVKRMGHDGTMYLDGNALLVPSNKIVMEVGFKKEVPADSMLYFRGSILYIDKRDHWEGLPKYTKRDNNPYTTTKGEKIEYSVTLYPTQKKWLYLLDMPYAAEKDSSIDRDLITTVKENINEPTHYKATSYLSNSHYDILDKVTLSSSKYFNKYQNPQTYDEAQNIKKSFNSQKNRASAIEEFFRNQSLTYTLKPDALDTNRTTDSFLFDKRKGYCVHFASSFVTMARMAGIPSRIVTGYKADKSESLNNYLAIKEKNAHAWAELYIDKSWVRYETTNTASNIDLENQTISDTLKDNEFKNPLIRKINLYLMYVKYNIETWILYYSHIRQLQLLEYAKNNPKFIFIFITSILALFILTFMFIAYFKRPLYKNEAMKILHPLLLKLKKRGYVKKDEESVHQFLLRYMSENTNIDKEYETIKSIDIMYEKIVYGADNSKYTKIKFKNIVKRGRSLI